MPDYYPPPRRTRVDQHSKQRKKNFILNFLIAVVFIAILIVGGNILFGGNGDKQSAGKDETNQSENTGTEEGGKKDGVNEIDENPDEGAGKEEDSDSAGGDETDGTADGESNFEDSETGNQDEMSGEIVEEESPDPNVLKTVVNPSWKPVGTTQTGEHVTRYDEGTADRIEMERALAYASGLQEGDIIVWWLQRGEVPNKNVIGTITSRDQQQIYRIYLEWVDGQGWKPTKLEYLKENDKKQ